MSDIREFWANFEVKQWDTHCLFSCINWHLQTISLDQNKPCGYLLKPWETAVFNNIFWSEEVPWKLEGGWEQVHRCGHSEASGQGVMHKDPCRAQLLQGVKREPPESERPFSVKTPI